MLLIGIYVKRHLSGGEMIKGQWKSIMTGFNETCILPTKEWDHNTKINLPKLHASNSIHRFDGLFLPPKDKAAVIVGASPCLNRDAEKLKECNDDFSIFCVNSALKFLLKKNIKPEYVVVLDSDEEDIYKHLNVDSKDLTLIASNIVSPKVLNNWKGKVWFLPYYGMKKSLHAKVKNRLGKGIPVGGNAFGTAVAMSIQLFGARIVILVGSECCYDKLYYPSKDIARENNAKPAEFFITDINGKERVTTTALHTYKLWIERLATEASPYIKIIDTSEGIMGKRDEKSYIYTYELSDIIKRVKEASNKKREIINANPALFNQPLYPSKSGRSLSGGSGRVNVRSHVPVCGSGGAGVSEMRST